MQTPVINETVSTRIGVDWLMEPLVFAVGAQTTLDNFSGCSLVGGIYLNGTLVLDLTASGRATIAAPSTVNIAVAAADIGKLGPGLYMISLGLVTASGSTQDLVNFPLQIVLP